MQEALVRLTEALVDGWPAASAAVPAVRSAGQPLQPTATSVPVRCAHGTPATPCCAACAVLDAAEAVLVEVQTPTGQAFPRSALELQVLEVLQAMYPLALNAGQLAQPSRPRAGDRPSDTRRARHVGDTRSAELRPLPAQTDTFLLTNVNNARFE